MLCFVGASEDNEITSNNPLRRRWFPALAGIPCTPFKPFIRLADGQSLLQKAFLRGATLPGVTEVLTVTNRELFFKAEDEFREINKAGARSFPSAKE